MRPGQRGDDDDDDDDEGRRSRYTRMNSCADHIYKR